MTPKEAREAVKEAYGNSEYTDEIIKALSQESITWIVGKDNCQVAVRNMPIDKMQKICAIIGEEEQQPCKDLRDATEEERKSTKDYIDSISKPTGLQFDDVYEELDFVQPHKKISVNLQLCEDAISRESVIEWLKDKDIIKTKNQEENARRELPPVTPSIKDWLSTFNTDSATECFTAVQELKKEVTSE